MGALLTEKLCSLHQLIDMTHQLWDNGFLTDELIVTSSFTDINDRLGSCYDDDNEVEAVVSQVRELLANNEF